MKLGWKGWFGFAISALLIWWTLRGVDLTEVVRLIGEANWWLLGASIFVATFGFLIRALRWRIILYPIDPDTALRSRFGAVTIGFMANNLLPARVGEFVRAWAMGRFERKVSVPAAFGSLVVERVLDGLILAAFLIGTVLTPSFPDVALGPQYTLLLRTAMVLIGGVGALLVALLLFPRAVVRSVERVARLLPGRFGSLIVDSMGAFLESLEVVRSPRLLFQAFAWSLAFWFWHGLSFWLGMLAFGIDTGLVSALFVEAVVGFGVAIPAAPGFFGTFHGSAIFALHTIYGVDVAATTAFAYAYHLGGFFPVTFIGLWYARSLGLSLSEMGRAEERVEARIEGDAHATLEESGR
ncbi:MAG: lysylphosphatidylglycerol synthase transmembrane domain-containing protein [Longimicrobiales bacterium]|nr:lysylphosphatidylglycerol synthase transmembrane domain-containing protein [Longimicrobiales bacterium]